MKGYFRTQWFQLLTGVVGLGLFIYNMIIGDYDMAFLWLVGAVVWLIMSRVDYNYDRIEALEKKAEKYDAMYDLVQELLEANKVDRQYADHLNRKIDSFIVDHKKKEKQK